MIPRWVEKLFGAKPAPVLVKTDPNVRRWGGDTWRRRDAEGWSGWWRDGWTIDAAVQPARERTVCSVNMGYGMDEPGYTGLELHLTWWEPPPVPVTPLSSGGTFPSFRYQVAAVNVSPADMQRWPGSANEWAVGERVICADDRYIAGWFGVVERRADGYWAVCNPPMDDGTRPEKKLPDTKR